MKFDDIANRNADRRETDMLAGLFVLSAVNLAVWALLWAWWNA